MFLKKTWWRKDKRSRGINPRAWVGWARESGRFVKNDRVSEESEGAKGGKGDIGAVFEGEAKCKLGFVMF